jgi:hypothetical protein
MTTLTRAHSTSLLDANKDIVPASAPNGALRSHAITKKLLSPFHNINASICHLFGTNFRETDGATDPVARTLPKTWFYGDTLWAIAM